MAKRKSKKKEFKITVKQSPLVEKEKKRILWECLDILFAGDPTKKENKNK